MGGIFFFFACHRCAPIAKDIEMLATLLAFASLLATGPDMGPTMAAGQLRWQRLQHHELLRGSGFESRCGLRFVGSIPASSSDVACAV
jgi:hypothetical protein